MKDWGNYVFSEQELRRIEVAYEQACRVNLLDQQLTEAVTIATALRPVPHMVTEIRRLQMQVAELRAEPQKALSA
jgi:hypothetical protein